MRRVTAAVFVDFDNLFSCLLEADRAAGLAFAQHPEVLLEHLSAPADGHRRDLLVRRAYLNPAGGVPDPAVDPGDPPEIPRRLPLAAYRPHLVRAGFEVVDCPTLVPGMKNAADIRMVVDAMDALADPVRYEEFVVVSADADFTPLLIKLRAQDRRTTIVAPRAIATAYRAIADEVIEGSQVLALVAPPARPPAPALAVVVPAPTSPSPPPPSTGRTDPAEQARLDLRARRAAGRAIAAMAAAADGPLSLSSVGVQARAAAGSPVVDRTKWFGHKTLTAFVGAHVPSVVTEGGRAWARSQAPATGGSKAAAPGR